MKKIICLLLLAALPMLSLTGCGEASLLSPKAPVTLSMWHVYGEQADSPMNRLVTEFNQTVGKEKGIVINVTMVTNSDSLGDLLAEAKSDRPGAPNLPDLFFAHPTHVMELGEEMVLDWKDCFSEEELSAYVESFVESGMVNGRLAVFPVAKSTFVLFFNGTQFELFSADTGVTYDSLSTWDGFFDAAAKYYEWSGGKVFCAFDSLTHSVEMDVLAKGGDPYSGNGWYNTDDPAVKESYMPFGRALVQGYIALSEPYASTMLVTGQALGGLGSSAGILYYSDMVTYPDNTSEPTNLHAVPLPKTNGVGIMPQTGVGLCALRTTDKKAEAAAVFARWLTEGQRNLEFAAQTGYMPVSNDAFDAIDSYDFSSEGYASLFDSIKTMREAYISAARPQDMRLFRNANIFCEKLRLLRSEFADRIASGENPEVLAEETWTLFCSIQ